MPATDAFIGPQPLHRIPTPQSASQNVSKIVDQFQYPPCVLRASQKHTYRSLSVVQLAGGSPISSACMCRQKRNITSQQKYWCQGTSPAKRNLKPKMASILDTLFGVSLSTDKKDGKQKPKPKIASKKLPLFPPPWAMEHEDSTQFADGESSHQLQPTSITRTNSAAAIPGQKFPQPYGT